MDNEYENDFREDQILGTTGKNNSNIGTINQTTIDLINHLFG